jgi:hypothetical protein
VLVQFPHYITPKALPSKHEGATLRKIGAKQYYVDSKHKKIVPSSKGNPEYWNLNGQAFALT